MRIAFVAEIWKPSVNGVVTRLSSSVDELLKAGHEVLIVAPHVKGAAAAEDDISGLSVRRVAAFSVSWVYGGQPWGWPTAHVGKHLDAFGPDLVHVVSPFSLGVAGVVAARRRRLPLVCSFHTDIAAYAGFYYLTWARPAIWLILKWLHNAARLNLVTSEHSMSLLTEHGVRHLKLWQRGVDVERFRPRPFRERDTDASGAPDSSGRAALPTALYVGRIAHEKGLSRLLPLARSGTVRLVLVGDGPGRAAIEREFAGTGTIFTGTLVGDELTAAYAAADVFVFPSTTETLGLVLLESLASGVPVVASQSPASRGLLAQTAAARLVPDDRPTDFAASVAELLESAAPDELAIAARREAEGWSWQAATRQLLGFYADVLQRGAVGTRATSAR